MIHCVVLCFHPCNAQLMGAAREAELWRCHWAAAFHQRVRAALRAGCFSCLLDLS